MKVDPFIEAEKLADRSVKHACCLLEVSRAAYYQRRNGEPSKREVTDAELTEKITAVHTASKGTYGSPRVHQELRQQGFGCGKRRVARLMRGAGLEGRCKKRWRKTTVVDPAAELARDLIQRHFGPCTEIDRRYVGDITYSAQFTVMCSCCLDPLLSRWFSVRRAAHNQRCSRKVKRRSFGRNRAGPGFGSASRWSVASLVARSASRYW